MLCCTKVLTFFLSYEIRTSKQCWPGLCSFDQPNYSFQVYAEPIREMNSRSEGRRSGLLERTQNMTHITDNPVPKLRKAPQPPLSHPRATPDSDRARRLPLAEPAANEQELNPGDRVEGLGNFGKPTGESWYSRAS